MIAKDLTPLYPNLGKNRTAPAPFDSLRGSVLPVSPFSFRLIGDRKNGADHNGPELPRLSTEVTKVRPEAEHDEQLHP